jgi:hypothetical protein
MTKPACMDEKEWLVWQDANERLWGIGRSESPCRDCTPLFHADMLAGGMCDGVPLPGDRPAPPVGPKIRTLTTGDRRDYWRQHRAESRARRRAVA